MIRELSFLTWFPSGVIRISCASETSQIATDYWLFYKQWHELHGTFGEGSDKDTVENISINRLPILPAQTVIFLACIRGESFGFSKTSIIYRENKCSFPDG